MNKIIIILVIAILLTLFIPKCKEHFDVVSNILYTNYEAPYKSSYDTEPPEYESDLSYKSSPSMKCCLIEKKFMKVDPKLNNQSTVRIQPNIILQTRPTFNLKPDITMQPMPTPNLKTNMTLQTISPEQKIQTKPAINYRNKYDNYLDAGQFGYTFTKLENEKCDPKLYDLDSNKQLFIEGDNSWSNNLCSNDTTDKKKIGSCRYANKECIDYIDKASCDKLSMQWSERTCNQPLDFVFVDKIKLNYPKFANDGSVDLFPQKPAAMLKGKEAYIFP